MLTYFIFLIFVGSTVAQITMLGQCPAVEVKPDFDPQQYKGQWFEQYKYFDVFETGLKCVTATYTPHKDDSIGVVHKGTGLVSGKEVQIAGLARAMTSEKAKLTVQFPTALGRPDLPLWILDTDYNTYAVVWSCQDLGFFSVGFLWIRTKERLPSDEIINKAYAVLDKNKLNKNWLMKSDQSSCPK